MKTNDQRIEYLEERERRLTEALVLLSVTTGPLLEDLEIRAEQSEPGSTLRKLVKEVHDAVSLSEKGELTL